MNLTATILAVVPDAWLIGFGIFQVGTQVVLALVVVSLNNRQRRLELLEERLVLRNDQLVDSKFAVMSGRLQGSIDALNDNLDRITGRLQEGEAEIRDVLSGSHKLELSIAHQIAQIKDFVRDNAASKDDVEKLDTRVERLSVQIAAKRGNA